MSTPLAVAVKNTEAAVKQCSTGTQLTVTKKAAVATVKQSTIQKMHSRGFSVHAGAYSTASNQIATTSNNQSVIKKLGARLSTTELALARAPEPGTRLHHLKSGLYVVEGSTKRFAVRTVNKVEIIRIGGAWTKLENYTISAGSMVCDRPPRPPPATF
jgi:hypothetical protein